MTQATGAAMHRFYTAAYDPIYFDPTTKGRFNAPDGAFGSLYTAATVHGAFAETFLRTPGASIITPDVLATKAYVRLKATRDLRFAELHGPGLAVLGATAEVVHSGLPYDVAQAWSKALYEHPGKFDGISYRSRHDDAEICFAIFDRAIDGIVEEIRIRDLDGDWFWKVAIHYNVGIGNNP